jgi:putative transcriptional regulator
LARLDETYEDRVAPAHAANLALVGDHKIVPEPLRSAIGEVPIRLRWRRLGIGLQEIVLPGSDGEIRASLMKISPGAAMPRHTHRGTELTLVLAGGFSDATGHYQRGDIILADGKINHQPIADRQGECLCFAVVDGGIRLSGAFGRIANLMLRL